MLAAAIDIDIAMPREAISPPRAKAIQLSSARFRRRRSNARGQIPLAIRAGVSPKAARRTPEKPCAAYGSPRQRQYHSDWLMVIAARAFPAMNDAYCFALNSANSSIRWHAPPHFALAIIGWPRPQAAIARRRWLTTLPITPPGRRRF